MTALVIPLDLRDAILLIERFSTILETRPDLALLNLREGMDQIDQSDFADENRSLVEQITTLLNEFEASLSERRVSKGAKRRVHRFCRIGKRWARFA